MEPALWLNSCESSYGNMQRWADAAKDVGNQVAVEADQETFILCRSQDRSHKEEAIVRRFEQKIETRLVSTAARCEKQNSQTVSFQTHRPPTDIARSPPTPTAQDKANRNVVTTLHSPPLKTLYVQVLVGKMG